MNAFETKVEHFRDRGNKQRFRQTGDTHQQCVGATENRNEKLLNDILLTNDDPLQLRAHVGVGRFQFFDGFLIGTRKFRVFSFRSSCGHWIVLYQFYDRQEWFSDQVLSIRFAGAIAFAPHDGRGLVKSREDLFVTQTGQFGAIPFLHRCIRCMRHIIYESIR